MGKYKRKDNIVNKKFYQFLLPIILSSIAVSLNEFADSIVVSQLLGSDAMSMVGMGSPVMFLFALVFTLFGVGGSAVYAELAGKQDQEGAERAFTIVFVVSVAISVLIAVIGVLFIDPLASVICGNEALIPEFKPYMTVLLFSGVFLIPVQVLISLLPAFGSPQVGTVINIVANGVNLLMDFVYISFFNTGLVGAAMATLTGYVLSAIIIIIMCLAKRLRFPVRRFGTTDIGKLGESVTRGAASSVSQLGYCIKVAFCNSLAISLAGMSGITVFTLCMQSVSIASIALSGIIEAMVPIVAALKGQRDFGGIRMLMRTVFIFQFVTSMVILALFELFPQILLFMYNVSGDGAEAAIVGIRIFSLIFIFRNMVILYMYYFQTISRKLYATVISVIDGFAGIVPLAYFLSIPLGINGLWLAFPILSVVMFAGIIITNNIIVKRSNGKYKGFLLLENEDKDIPIYDATVPLDKEKTSAIVEAIQDFCRENIKEGHLPVMIALAFEEMFAYTSINLHRKNAIDEVDVLIKIMPEYILMDIRSIGEPLDPTTAPSGDYSNIDVLKKVASVLEYNYVMGMNQTRIRMQNA